SKADSKNDKLDTTRSDKQLDNSHADNKDNVGNGDVNEELSELGELSKKLALQMNKGDFKEIVHTLSPLLKLQLTEDVLKQAWDSVVTDLGSYKGISKISEEVVDNSIVVIVVLNYDNNGIQV